MHGHCGRPIQMSFRITYENITGFIPLSEIEGTWVQNNHIVIAVYGHNVTWSYAHH